MPQRVALTALQELVEEIGRGGGVPRHPMRRAELTWTTTSVSATARRWTRCERIVTWRRETPAHHLTRLAAAAVDLDLAWDTYGERGAVARLEAELAGPARHRGRGGDAQRGDGAAGGAPHRCDRAGSRRVALPDLPTCCTTRRTARGWCTVSGWSTSPPGGRTATAADLAAIPGRLGAALVELPLRDAGCLLPPWDELVELSEAARERGVALHLDGARLWESQASYDRPFPEIVALFDSVYVSLYKGLGAMSGAVVATDADTAAELRLWRTRMGGTLMRLTPFALGGLLGLHDELPRMGEYLAWARTLAAELTQRGLRVHPEVPHISTFEVYADGPADAINERLIVLMEREHAVLCFPWRATDAPGTAMTEVAFYGAALDFEPAP